ncbi:MAG: SdiA-regulated domain-containing protein [Acidobacteriota bacterium]
MFATRSPGSAPAVVLSIAATLLPTALLAEDPTTACVSETTLGVGLPAISMTFAGCDGVSRPSGNALDELSGLTAVAGSSWLWTLSDSKENLYRSDENGGIGSNDQGNKIDLGDDGSDLEGVVEVDGALYAVEERAYTVVVTPNNDPDPSPRTHDIQAVACDDPDSAELCTYLDASASNDRFEGITFTGDVFYIVKEKNPGLLLAVDPTFTTIIDYWVLNCGSYGGACPSNHPFPNTVGGSTQDFSGLSWDVDSGLLWIASDKAGAVFLYDPIQQTYSTYPLTVTSGDTCSLVPTTANQCIQQAEGVAVVDGDVLRVVNDRSHSDNTIIYEYTITRP